MTMILQLLVAAVAVGLGVDATLGTPPYKEYLQAMKEAAATLEKNILSMKGKIPLLNDYRRHYAEIVYVVNSMGIIMESGCGLEDYDKTYQEFLNISAPYAISDPEWVVDEIRRVQFGVHNNIDQLKNLIDACVQTSEVCNKCIDDTVKKHPHFRDAANVLMAAGDVATDLNVLNGKRH